MEIMESEYLLSFLLGVFLKIYDDFIDLQITSYPIVLDISKIAIILTTYVLLHKYYILGIFIVCALFVSNYCKRFDDPFWDAYALFVVGWCLMNYNKIYELGDHLTVKIGCILFLLVCIFFEETMYLEETSNNKIMSRSYSILLNTIMVGLLEYFGSVEYYGLDFFVALVTFINSYLITNIIIQKTYLVYGHKPATESLDTLALQEKSEDKTTTITTEENVLS